MNKRVLLAWELGGGRGHTLIVGWVAEALKKRGFMPVVAVQQLESLESLPPGLNGIDCLQAPVWPGVLNPSPFWSPGRAVTLGDALAEFGLRSQSATRHVIGAWDRLLALVKPAAVIADYAPGLLLAARGAIPTIAVGEGLPSTMESFAPFRSRNEKPKYDESDLLEVVNECLSESSRPTLTHLPEIFMADRSCVATFTELDPYAVFRTQPNAGPWAPEWDRSAPRDERELFGYFSMRTSFQPVVLKALQEVARSGIPVRIHMPPLNDEARSLLEESGITVERAPLPFAEIQRNARLVASLGSFSFVSCAMVAGIPQIVFPTAVPQKNAGTAIEKLGVGRSLIVDGENPLEPILLAQALIDAYRDEKIAARAKQLAPDFERRLEPRPEEVVAGLVEELVGPA